MRDYTFLYNKIDMSNVAQNLKKVLADLPEGVRLVAVSKFHPVEMLREVNKQAERCGR